MSSEIDYDLLLLTRKKIITEQMRSRLSQELSARDEDAVRSAITQAIMAAVHITTASLADRYDLDLKHDVTQPEVDAADRWDELYGDAES